MGNTTIRHTGWLAPVGIGVVGVPLSGLAFWMADKADDQRVRTILEFRSEWRARDLEAKVRLSANAVENVAIAMPSTARSGPISSARSRPAPRAGCSM